MSEQAVRYLRCTGPDVTNHPSGASAVLVRLEHQDESWIIAGYVILNDRDEVIEKSDWYGRYEGNGDWIEQQNQCLAMSREDFAAAWRQPYARRSPKRRVLSNLNGCRDDRDPSESDDPPSN